MTKMGDKAFHSRIPLSLSERWAKGDFAPVSYTAGSVSNDFWDDSPDLLTAAKLAQRLNITATSVEALVQDGKLLSVGGENIPVRYPACQVADGAILPGLDQVLAVADGRRWAIYELLNNPQPEFNGATGAEMLQRGDIEPVIAHLSGYGDGFA
jgi:hypothetical protein